MSKKDDDNPFEEMQKQLRDLFKNKNVQVAFAPFMQSMTGNDDAAKNEEGGAKESPRKTQNPRGMKSWIVFVLSIVSPKKYGIT